MNQYLLVAAGGAAGTALHFVMTTSSRVAPERAVVVANLVASALLGALVAIGPRESLVSLIGLGFLGAAAPFAALGLQASVTEGPHRTRRIVMGVTANVVAGAAMALLGYLSIRFGTTLYHKLR